MPRAIVVEFRGDERDLVRSSQRGGSALAGFAKGAVRAGAALATGFAARKVVQEINKTVTAASDQREQISQSEQVFKSSSREINRWSRTASRNFGLTRTEALTNANAFGDMFQQLHIGEGRARAMSTGMVELAADLASFKNADISQVLEAQQSAFRGEYDALQRFIPGINAARVQQVALNLTHKQSAKDLTDADKALAVHSIMMKDSTRAQGDFARTAEGLANARRTIKAVFGDIGATIGSVFEPAVRRSTFWVASELGPALLRVSERHAPALGKSVDRMALSFVSGLPKGKQLEGMLDRWALKLPKIEGVFRTASLGVKAFFAAGFGGEGITTESGTFVGTMERLGVAAAGVGPKLRQAWAAFREGKGSGDQLVPTLKLSGAMLGFVADHADTLAKHIPLLVAGFGAYKAAQALSNVASAAQVALMPAQIAATFALARANKSLATSSTQVVVGQGAQRGAVVVSTVATNLSTGAMLRQRAAALAAAAGQKIAAAGALVWRGAQMALNFALSANPIGLVILAIAALAAGIVIAYKRSATFRAIVQGAWRGIQGAASGAWSVVRKILANLATGFLNVAGSIVRSAATAFGWVPGVGPKLRTAAAKFEEFRGRAQTAIDRLRGKTVTVTAKARLESARLYFSTATAAVRERAQKGLKLPGYGGGDRRLILAEDGEAVVPKELASRDPGFIAWAKAKGIPGYQSGGMVRGPHDPRSVHVGAGYSGTPAVWRGMGTYQRDLERSVATGTRHALADWWKRAGALGYGAGRGWRWQMAVLRQAFPGLALISGFRPGAITSTGNRSYHALGRAVDVPPRWDVFNWISARYGKNTKELIFTPAEGRQIKNGAFHVFTGGTIRRDHYSHIHWAMRHGGLVRAASGLAGYTDGPTLILAGESGREHVNIQPAQRSPRVPVSAMYGQPIILDVTLTIDGQVLDRRLERIRGRDARRDTASRGGKL